MRSPGSVSVKSFRLKLKLLALQMEMLEFDNENLLSLPDYITNTITNLQRDMAVEISLLKGKRM